MDQETEQLLADLAKHPAWGVLKVLVAERKVRDVSQLGWEVYRKGEVPTSRGSELRGFYRGADWLLGQVDKAFRNVYEEKESP
jgi:hypothetical protein